MPIRQALVVLTRSTQSKKVALGKLTPLAKAATLVELSSHVPPRFHKGAAFGDLARAIGALKIKKNLYNEFRTTRKPKASSLLFFLLH